MAPSGLSEGALGHQAKQIRALPAGGTIPTLALQANAGTTHQSGPREGAVRVWVLALAQRDQAALRLLHSCRRDSTVLHQMVLLREYLCTFVASLLFLMFREIDWNVCIMKVVFGI